MTEDPALIITREVERAHEYDVEVGVTRGLAACHAAGWRIVVFYDVEPTLPAKGTISEEWVPPT